MKLSWDEAKRQYTLNERGLDFAWAAEVFVGDTTTSEDLRFDYGEQRFISYGHISGRLCVVVWTQRENIHHIISMRKANEREQKWFYIKVRPSG
jgi:uncharacterized protein